MDKVISDGRAKEAEIAALKSCVVELENRRPCAAIRLTGEVLSKFLPEDE